MVETLCLVPLPDQQPNLLSLPPVQRRFGGKSLLEWIVRRVADAQRIDRIVTIVSEADATLDEVKHLPPDVTVYISNESDPLGRACEALREHPSRAVIQVTPDSPFVDPVLIDRLVIAADTHPNFDYIGYCFGDGRPVIKSRIGVFAECCRADAIFNANRATDNPADRRDATSYIRAHPEMFCLRLIPVPMALDRDNLRLTLKIEEDWDHVREIYEALGPENLEWQKITSLLDQQPDMLRSMARLNRADVGGIGW